MMKNISLIIFFLLGTFICEAYAPSAFVSEEVWQTVQAYLLPENLPIKAELDALFGYNRATMSREAMIQSGFFIDGPRKHTQLIVAKHLNFPGYVFKLYLDDQTYYRERPEHYWWIKRINGAANIQGLIDQMGWNNTLTTPKKWIYPLPDYPSPPSGSIRKNFILVEEDMNIFERDINKKCWMRISPELLFEIYSIVEAAGLCDAKPANIPFCRDGRFAFVDTQNIQRWPVSYHAITILLSGDQLEFWLELIKGARKSNLLDFAAVDAEELIQDAPACQGFVKTKQGKGKGQPACSIPGIN